MHKNIILPTSRMTCTLPTISDVLKTALIAGAGTEEEVASWSSLHPSNPTSLWLLIVKPSVFRDKSISKTSHLHGGRLDAARAISLAFFSDDNPLNFPPKLWRIHMTAMHMFLLIVSGSIRFPSSFKAIFVSQYRKKCNWNSAPILLYSPLPTPLESVAYPKSVPGVSNTFLWNRDNTSSTV